MNPERDGGRGCPRPAARPDASYSATTGSDATTEVVLRIDAARTLSGYGLIGLIAADLALFGVSGHLDRVARLLAVA